jgi:ketosteroid isomerase-like protein
MSEENVELARRGYEAFERGDLSAALEIFDPEMVTSVAPPIPVAGTYRGPEGFLQVMLDWAEAFDELVQTGEEFIDAGEKVVVRTHHNSRGVGSGVPVERDFWYVWTVRSGKAVRLDIFNERDEALEAAALSE